MKLTITNQSCGLGSSDELKRLQPPGQATPSGSTTAVRIGGVTRVIGCGHTISSVLSTSFPLSNISSSANLMRLVLTSEVGRSAAEKSNKTFYKVVKQRYS